MEDPASGNAEPLLATMKALARRGALLVRQADGTGVIAQTDARRSARRIEPQAFLTLLDAGWLRSTGADRFVISRRGATAIRNRLNHPQPTAVTSLETPAEPDATSPSRPPVQPRRCDARPDRNLRESPLAWLAQRRDKDGKPMISADELEAGERLRLDFERGQMGQRVTSSWDAAAVPSRQPRGAPRAGLEMADAVLAARQRVELALKAVGPELAGMLLDVCCFLKGLEQAERNGGWPRRAGKVVLQLGLAHLARHYGPDRREKAGPARVESWHATGWGIPEERRAMPGTADKPTDSGKGNTMSKK